MPSARRIGQRLLVFLRQPGRESGLVLCPEDPRLVRGLLSSPGVTLVQVDRDHLQKALELFEAHPDKRWSFTDCTSFVAMRDLGITRAFAFDRNFEQAGFERLP